MTSQRELTLRVLEQCLLERGDIASAPIVKMLPSDLTERIRQKLAVPSHSPTPISNVLESADLIFQHRLRMDHPRFFGFIPSPASHASWLGDILTSACNTHAGSWMQSSGPSAVEMRLLEWMACDIVGFPPTAGGCFVSGGSMANLTALTVARDQNMSYEDRPRAVIYLSSQTHHSVAKGLKVLGFHTEQIRPIPCNSDFRINPISLQEAITTDRQANNIPFLLIGNCGTTNTGSIDPLDSLADIAAKEGLWFHIDGAYGASALLAKSQRPLMNGIARCDSLSWDAHKWLFQTYDCGMVLVRDRKLLRESFSVSAEYVQDAMETEDTLPNFWNYGIELTRPARAMKLWFTLQLEGLDKIQRDIEHGVRLAEVAEEALRGRDGWEVVSSAKLAIVCFRYRPQGMGEGQLDALNAKISQVAIAENLAAPLTTRLNGVVVLRMCCIHPDLEEEEMVGIVQGLDRTARAQCKPLVNGA